MNYIMSSVGTLQLFDCCDGNLVATSKTLTDSSISVNVTADDVRGGLNGALLGRFFHDSTFEMSITDALFNLDYIALNIGGAVTVGGVAFTSESITTTVANEITVTGEPQDFCNFGKIGYYAVGNSTTSEQNWIKIMFDDKTATVTDLPVGTTVCVKYFDTVANMRQFTVPSNIVPQECYAILTAPLYAVGHDCEIASSAKAADLVVEIPRFQLSGAQEITMNMSGAATTSLSGQALAVYDNSSCSDAGYYAKVKEVHYTGDVYDNLTTLALSPAEIEMQKSTTASMSVIGIYGSLGTGEICPADLTYTVAQGSGMNVSVDATTGIISAGTTAGEATIEVAVTSHPEKVAYAVITVTN